MSTKLHAIAAVHHYHPGQRLLAAVFILFFLPVLLVTAFLVRCEARGPVLISRPGRGQNGEIVEIWSFRCARGRNSGRIDRFLRISRLANLPHLFNILRGELGFDSLFE